MDDESASFHPVRDVRSQRVHFWLLFTPSAIWTVIGPRWALTTVDTTLTVLGAVLGIFGVVMAALVLLGRRAGLGVDATGLRWWGGFGRSTSIRWADVERIVVADRGSPYGTKVGIEVQTAGGERLSVPPDALAGLAESKHSELRRHVLGSVVRSAREAGVASVITPSGEDPLVI